MADDQWTWYKLALAGKAPPLSDDGTVQSGFYSTRASKAGGRIPVAIWTAADGTLNCRFGTQATRRTLTIEQCLDRWTYIHGNPVDRDAYKVAYETGTWPDGTPTVAPDAGVGDNRPSDPFERLKAEVDDKLASAVKFLEGEVAPVTKTMADRARNLQAELLALNKTADARHKAEKQPHLDAGRAVDEKFRFRTAVENACARLRAVYEKFMLAEEDRQKAEQEKAWKAEQARIAAERAKLEAERAKLMADDPIAALTSPEPELPELPLPPAPVKVNVGGGVGRAAGLKSVWVGKVTDYKACLAHFSDHDDVKALIAKLVDRAVKANKSQTKIPGVVVTEDRRAA